MSESKRTASTAELQPRLLCDEGLIQIGNGRHLFVLSFVIGAVDNLDLVIITLHCSSKNNYKIPSVANYFQLAPPFVLIRRIYCVFKSVKSIFNNFVG